MNQIIWNFGPRFSIWRILSLFLSRVFARRTLGGRFAKFRNFSKIFGQSFLGRKEYFLFLSGVLACLRRTLGGRFAKSMEKAWQAGFFCERNPSSWNIWVCFENICLFAIHTKVTCSSFKNVWNWDTKTSNFAPLQKYFILNWQSLTPILANVHPLMIKFSPNFPPIFTIIGKRAWRVLLWRLLLRKSL